MAATLTGAVRPGPSVAGADRYGAGVDDRYRGFPAGFFDRVDEADDRVFYVPPRLVTHIDDAAIAAVGRWYAELGLGGSVLDLMSSWVSHFERPPAELVALGLNDAELRRNEAATSHVVHDLNADPTLPFDDDRFDAVVCCVSVDYLTRPLEVFDEVHRVLRAGGPFAISFSNRCFPTKAIGGWLYADDEGRAAIVAEYFARTGPWRDLRAEVRSGGVGGDPLYAVHARAA
jgi:SAM-dependent methyltransferase